MNRLFIYLCYSTMMLWIFFPKIIFFQLIVVLYILGTTIDEMQPEEKRRNIKTKRGGK